MRNFYNINESIKCTCPRCNEDFWEDVEIELKPHDVDDEFNRNLLILFGKSHRLTKEEEDSITKLANKFRYE